jgi:hypothetical protein
VSKYELTEDSFNNLIKWLAEGGKEPGKKYEEIRSNLINYLSWNGCHNPGELADEAINIVASKLPQLAQDYEGDPGRYFLGVGRNLVKRQNRLANLYVKFSPDLKAPENNDEEEFSCDEIIRKCKKECLHKLSESKKKLISSYYEKGGKHDADFREIIAAENNMHAHTLRVNIYRIRQALKKCFVKCKERR